jgi:hypothetical protein
VEKTGYHGSQPEWRRRAFNPGVLRLVGVELEHEARDAATMQRILAEFEPSLGDDAKHFIAEVDGSIDRVRGTEFISAPLGIIRAMSPDSPIRKLLAHLNKYDPPPQRDRAGLHVNLNRAAYANPHAAAWVFNAMPTLNKLVAGRNDGFTGPYGDRAYSGFRRIASPFTDKYHPAAIRGIRIEARIYKSPNNEEELERRITHAVTLAEWTNKSPHTVTRADNTKDPDAAHKSLVEGYVDWLSTRKAAASRELFKFISRCEKLTALTPTYKKEWIAIRGERQSAGS